MHDTAHYIAVNFMCMYDHYLVHASLIESHYGGMGHSVKHSPQGLLGVQLLWLEKLIHEPFVEHGGDDVIHN